MCCQCCVRFLWDNLVASTTFHSYFCIVEKYTTDNTAKEFKGQYESFQERFGILFVKTHGKRSAAITESGTENVEFGSYAIFISIRFPSVNLHGIATAKDRGTYTSWQRPLSILIVLRMQRYYERFLVPGQSVAYFSLLQGTYDGFFIVFHSDNCLVASI